MKTKPILNRRLLKLAAAGLLALAPCSPGAAATGETGPAKSAPVAETKAEGAQDVATSAGHKESAKKESLPDLAVEAKRDITPEDKTALKMPATLHETPRSIVVVDSERIRERNYNSMDDMMDSVPGVFVNSRNLGGYHYISRGFRMTPNETLIDGFPGIYAGGGQASLPLYGVEKVVFLKGPAGLLYGSASNPGGMINIITRKPEEEQKTSVTLSTSTYAGNGVRFGERTGAGAELDSTGALSDDLLYRVGLAGDSTDHYTDRITNRNRYGQGAITWKILEDDRLKFTPVVQYLSTATPGGAGMVMSPTSSMSTNDGSTAVDKNRLSPLNVNLYEGGRKDEVVVTGFDFNADNHDDIRINASYRYIGYDSRVNMWSPVVNTAAQRDELVNNGLVSRTQTKRDTLSDRNNFDVNASLESRPGSDLKNRLMAGVNGRHTQSRARNAAGPLATPQSPVDINTGAATTPVADRSTGWLPWSEAESFEWNTYLQDQLAVFDERLVFTGGLGYGQLHTAGQRTLRGDVTPNASVLCNITRNVATYASYSTSYSFADASTIYEDANGNTFTPDPSKGDNKEVGLKYQLPRRKTTASVAYFWTERTDVLTQSNAGELNPNGNRYYFMQEGQRAEGVEFSTSVFLTDNWNLDGSFAWITGAYRNGTAYDTPLAKTPEFSCSLFSRHKFTEGSMKGFGHYIGVTWQDERLGGNGSRTAAAPDPLILPAFFRVDAGLDYEVNEKLRVGFHVYNLLDEVILVDGTTGANIQIDAPRTFTLKVTYLF